MSLTKINNNSDHFIRDVIARIAVGPNRGRDITALEAQEVMSSILEDQVDPIQAAIFLIALRMKRESIGEYQGISRALQSSIDQKSCSVDELVCLADPYDGYLRYVPASPFVPCILAACGLPTLICGVETMGPKHGVTAHKVYKLAGINPLLSTQAAIANIECSGWSYLDQSKYAPALFSLSEFRGRIVKRTALTTLERLLMPIKATKGTHMVLGYVHKAYPEIYSNIAEMTGYSSTLLTKGVEGGFVPPLNKPLRQFHFDFQAQNWNATAKKIVDLPEDFTGVSAAQKLPNKINQCDSAAEDCLEHGLKALAGEHNSLRNSLIITASQILSVYRQADSFSSAVDKVQHCLDNGAAQDSFRSLIEN